MFCLRPIAIAVLVWSSAAAVLHAESNPLEQVPDGALGFAVIGDLGEANEKLATLTTKMQVPVPDVLSLVKTFAGIAGGINESGGLAIAAVPSSEEEGAPMAWYGFVPVTDYQQFIAGLAPADAEAQVTEITLFGQMMLVGQKSDFAVVALDTENPQALEKLLADETSVFKAVEPLKEWMAAQQLSIVITPAGKSRMFQAFAEALPDQDQLEADAGEAAEEELPPSALAGVAQLFGSFKELIAEADQQLTHLAVGLEIEDNATLHLAAKALFTPEGKLSNWAAGVKLPPEGLLAGVPPGDYVFAYGGVAAQFSPEVWEIFNQMTQSGLEVYGLDEEGRKQYAESQIKLQEGKRFTGGVMGMLRPGDSLFTTTITIEHVNSAEEHLKLTRQGFDVLQSAAGNPETEAPLYHVAEVKVGEIEALEIVTDFDAVMQLEGDGEAEEAIQGMFGQMFGREGKLSMYVAKANDKTVVSAYSKEQLVRGVEHVRSGDEGLEMDADIAKTTALLPEGSQWVLYANPEGVMQLVGNMMEGLFGGEVQFPAFPPSEPIGLAARVNETALDAEIVLPDSAVAGLGQFIFAIGQMFQGGAPVP